MENSFTGTRLEQITKKMMYYGYVHKTSYCNQCKRLCKLQYTEQSVRWYCKDCCTPKSFFQDTIFFKTSLSLCNIFDMCEQIIDLKTTTEIAKKLNINRSTVGDYKKKF